MAYLPKNQAGVGSPDAQTTKGSFGMRFGALVSVIGVVWAYVSLFAGPSIGQIPAFEPALGAPFWSGLLFTFLWKIRNKKGTIGFIVGVLIGIGVLALAVGVAYLNRVQENEAQVTKMNQGLPRMIREDIRLDSMNLSGHNLVFGATVIGLSADEIDARAYSEEARASVARGLCEDPQARAGMRSGTKYVYDFKDESGAKLANVEVDISDCE